MFKTVLVPLDGSEYSERALTVGRDVANVSGARMILLTVVTAYRDAHVPPVPELQEQVRKRAEAYLEPLLKKTRDAGLQAVGRVGYGEPSQEIISAARENEADLIVMSTHGIGATGRHALGSVAMKVLQTADCPVMMLRIPEGISLKAQ